MIGFTDGRVALAAVERLAAVGVLVAALETLVQPGPLSDNGLGSWLVFRLSSRWTMSSRFAGAVGWLLEYPRVRFLFALRAAVATAVLVGVLQGDAERATIATVIVFSSILLAIRSPYGSDGADQMLILCFASAGIAHAFGSPLAFRLALGFIALQTCLSYFTAGFAKLVSPLWRSGAALQGIFDTEIYGHPAIGSIMTSSPALATFGSWAIISLECILPSAIITPRSLTLALLCGAGLFHLAAAVFMRLNTFLWAFLATYPAILFSSRDLLHTTF